MRREELYLTDISEAAEAMASFLSGVARADFSRTICDAARSCTS